ncbi:MAG: AMP-binding protein [Acidobacteriaceae bacterium]|nr:AMP-binding protein [Acidobacteriaceae bacterium]
MTTRTNLATLLDEWQTYGRETAIVRYSGNRSRRTSYRQLYELATRFACLLEQQKIASGERVVLWGQNSAEWVAVFFGCALRGVIVVPLDAAGSVDFARRVIAETTPRLLCGDAALLSQLDGSVPAIPFENLTSDLGAPFMPQFYRGMGGVHLTRDTPLQIIFTSGTTAEPKGIVHTHGNILASIEPIEQEIRKYRSLEHPFHPLRFLNTLPLSHVFGQTMGMWLPPLLAAEVHFESRLEAERLVRTIRRQRISVLVTVPRMMELIRSHLLLLDDSIAEQLESTQGLPVWKRMWRFRRVHRLLGWKFWAFICGGAALPLNLEQFWSTLGFAVIQGYGMTETSALITLNHPFKIGRGTLGKPLPGREIRIADDGEISVRGEMVATSTWQHGHVEQRKDSWLATGDLVSSDSDGQIHFAGRKSEVIVTSAGLNIHPEDIEAALLNQSQITACAVVPVEGQAVAVLLAPQGKEAAKTAVDAANRSLQEFQRIQRWLLWPDADLPRTSLGKPRRGVLADWAAHQIQNHNEAGGMHVSPLDVAAATTKRQLWGTQIHVDPLLSLLASITHSPLDNAADAARLSEDLGLDSLGRLQLQTIIEQRFGVALSDEAMLRIETLGQLREAVVKPAPVADSETSAEVHNIQDTAIQSAISASDAAPPKIAFRYPRWPWGTIISMLRIIFIETVLRPLVWILLRPPVVKQTSIALETQIVIANHVTFFDAALVLYALPPRLRHRLAIASAGEMIEDWRHARNQPNWFLNAVAPLQYWLTTALFNIFPLPRQAGFRRSLAHIGEALDSGYSVLIFPEGRRSLEGTLLPFRSGIGVVARESGAKVLPIAMKGIYDTAQWRRRWFHAGIPEIRIGTSISPHPQQSAENIAGTLHETMQNLLQ